jgi:hypothetical protein
VRSEESRIDLPLRMAVCSDEVEKSPPLGEEDGKGAGKGVEKEWVWVALGFWSAAASRKKGPNADKE